MKRAVIIGTGSYLPRTRVTNLDLMARGIDTNDEWVVQRTGITARHISDDDEPTSFMATQAALRAMDAAGVTPDQVDGIIVATTTPDQTFPSTAVMVQAALGVRPSLAFDIQAVCSGFVYALSVASSMIASGAAHTMVVIGAERFTNLLDWNDRTTCVLFGDGAGAVVLRAADGSGTMDDRGILASHLYADGREAGILHATGGPGTTRTTGVTHMAGREVFKHAVAHMAAVVDEALVKNGLTADQIDWLVPHQANLRIISATAEKLNLPMERVVVTVDQHGNTSAASIPLALDVAVRDGRIKPGQLILLEALGAGLTWGAVVVRV
jgi:3-oxoacyl-[acyl-carrier-protein] synthase-3